MSSTMTSTCPSKFVTWQAVSILIAGTRCSAMEGTTSLSIHSPTNSYRPHTQCTAEYLNRPPPGVRVSIWTEKPRSVVRSGPGQNSIRINVAVVAHKGPTFEVSYFESFNNLSDLCSVIYFPCHSIRIVESRARRCMG